MKGWTLENVYSIFLSLSLIRPVCRRCALLVLIMYFLERSPKNSISLCSQNDQTIHFDWNLGWHIWKITICTYTCSCGKISLDDKVCFYKKIFAKPFVPALKSIGQKMWILCAKRFGKYFLIKTDLSTSQNGTFLQTIVDISRKRHAKIA